MSRADFMDLLDQLRISKTELVNYLPGEIRRYDRRIENTFTDLFSKFSERTYGNVYTGDEERKETYEIIKKIRELIKKIYADIEPGKYTPHYNEELIKVLDALEERMKIVFK